MAEGNGLLNRHTGLNLYRGFESLPHRQFPNPQGMSSRSDPGAVRVRFAPSPDRLPAHRRRPHGAVQLALRAPARRRSSSCASTTPTQQRNVDEALAADPRRLPLAGHRLGRGRRGRRAARPVLPVAAAGPLSGRRRAPARRAASLPRLRHARGDQGRARRGRGRRKRPYRYSRRWLAGTPSDRARFEAEGRRPWCA